MLNLAALDEYIEKIKQLRSLLEDPILADLIETLMLADEKKADDRPKHRPSYLIRRAIWKRTEPFTPWDIQEETGVEFSRVSSTLSKMARDGEITLVRKGSGRAASVYEMKRKAHPATLEVSKDEFDAALHKLLDSKPLPYSEVVGKGKE